jgi:hypothetical protein
LVPIRPGQKAPTDAGWTKRAFAAKDFAKGDNIGVKNGEPSHWLTDTDCDCPEAVACAAALMPETSLVHGRASRRRSHLWFVVPGAETTKFTDLDANAVLLEIRSTGSQTVIPPSVHPSGEAVEWDSDGVPMAMDLADYLRAVRMTAIATLFARHWPAGDRHTAAGHIAGFLARLGFSAHETAKIVGTAARIGGDEEHEDRERVARDTARKHEGGGKTTGTPKLVEALPQGKALVAKVYHWMGRKGDEFLDALNKRHFVAQLGTKPVVGTDDDDDAGVEFQTFDDFKHVYYAQRVGKVRLGEWWLSNPSQRRFRKVVFKPPPLVAHPDDYNIWKGFAVKPDVRPEPHLRCARFLDHVGRVLCSENAEHMAFLLDVFAVTVQHPGQPSGVAVVWRGDQGTGKGTVMELFGSLFGKHYAHLSSGDSLTGAFNGHLSGKVVVFADEAVWGGGKKDAGELKRLVTEKTIHVNRKHINQVEEPNCVHLFLATNEEWVWPVSLKERRGFILDVELLPHQTPQYFQDIRDEWADGGAEAFLAFCLQREIPGGRLGPIPKTQALADQFVLSMDFVQQWWFEKLSSGEFIPGQGWPDFLASAHIYEDFMRTMSGIGGQSRRKTESQILQQLRKYLPDRLTRSRKMTPVDTSRFGESPRWEKLQRAGWLLPSLGECRLAFEVRTGMPRVWPEPLSLRVAEAVALPMGAHEEAIAEEAV